MKRFLKADLSSGNRHVTVLSLRPLFSEAKVSPSHMRHHHFLSNAVKGQKCTYSGVWILLWGIMNHLLTPLFLKRNFRAEQTQIYFSAQPHSPFKSLPLQHLWAPICRLSLPASSCNHVNYTVNVKVLCVWSFLSSSLLSLLFLHLHPSFSSIILNSVCPLPY